MNAKELLAILAEHVEDGRGLEETVVVEFEGRRRSIERVEVRLLPNGQPRPKPTFVLIVADGLV